MGFFPYYCIFVCLSCVLICSLVKLVLILMCIGLLYQSTVLISPLAPVEVWRRKDISWVILIILRRRTD